MRVGLAAAKGLAEAFGKPVVAVSNLQAIAAFGSGPLRAVFFDARRGEIYGGLYNAALEAVAPEVVAKFPAWIDSLPHSDIEFLTTNLAPFRDALAGRTVVETPRALAGAIGRIAAARFAHGLALDAAPSTPTTSAAPTRGLSGGTSRDPRHSGFADCRRHASAPHVFRATALIFPATGGRGLPRAGLQPGFADCLLHASVSHVFLARPP